MKSRTPSCDDLMGIGDLVFSTILSHAEIWVSGRTNRIETSSTVAKAFNVWYRTGLPPRRRNCFGTSLFILEPLPPATIIANFFISKKNVRVKSPDDLFYH